MHKYFYVHVFVCTYNHSHVYTSYVVRYLVCVYYTHYFIPIEIPPVENLMAIDKCSTVTTSWDINEGSCTGLSYNVTLSSSDGITLGPFTTTDTAINFTITDTLNGPLNVTVFPYNGHARGVSITITAVNGVLKNG